MPPRKFIAESAVDAAAQIRSELGPNAVVLNVRRVPGSGWPRFWNKPRIEVLAHVPDPPAVAVKEPDPLAELRSELAAIRKQVESRPHAEDAPPEALLESAPDAGRAALGLTPGGWRIGPFLECTGLLPLHAQRVVEELRSILGDAPPPSFAKELDLARGVLLRLWEARGAADSTGSVHIFIGPQGSGKTTVLCKQLAQAVLVEGRAAEVWRLDGRSANTAESLSVYCDILNVPVSRCAQPRPRQPGESLFIDLPGVDWTSTQEIRTLAARLRELPAAKPRLVLNAAYSDSVLLAQARAFASLDIGGLVVTHLDEEPRWGKVWNLVLGTNFSVEFLSAGQNVPGVLHSATPEKLLERQMPCKQRAFHRTAEDSDGLANPLLRCEPSVRRS